MEDRYLLTRSELEDRIAVLLGGRVAEEIVYGEVSTGAHNDLERATELARLMVTQYGMSERLGPVTFGERQQPMFLKGAGGRGGEREYSEATARVDRRGDPGHHRPDPTIACAGSSRPRRRVLVDAAGELKRVETLEGERLKRLLAGEA